MREYLIDDASAEILPELLVADAPVVRLFAHYPSVVLGWRETSLQLSPDGEPRTVSVRGLCTDIELPTDDFIAWIGDFSRSGFHLVQSERPLPAELDPGNFRGEDSYLKVLGSLGACLLFSLPHANETAALTLFRDRDIAAFEAAHPGAREN